MLAVEKGEANKSQTPGLFYPHEYYPPHREGIPIPSSVGRTVKEPEPKAKSAPGRKIDRGDEGVGRHWTDIDKLLDRFNYCRQRCCGIRQLLRATKADNKRRTRLLGTDVPMKEAIDNWSQTRTRICSSTRAATATSMAMRRSLSPGIWVSRCFP